MRAELLGELTLERLEVTRVRAFRAPVEIKVEVTVPRRKPGYGTDTLFWTLCATQPPEEGMSLAAGQIPALLKPVPAACLTMPFRL